MEVVRPFNMKIRAAGHRTRLKEKAVILWVCLGWMLQAEKQNDAVAMSQIEMSGKIEMRLIEPRDPRENR